MNDEKIAADYRKAAEALKAVSAQLHAELVVSNGLALVLIKAGILSATGVELMRAVGASTYTDPSIIEAISERVEGLHSLINKFGQGSANAPKYDS